jgi:putative two-component system response regulator
MEMPSEDQQAKPRGSSNPVILVVDDHQLSRELLKTYLAIAGYEIIEAANGAEALEALETNTPNLVLLDIIMPKVDGFEVCQKIKENPETAMLPVIMVTGLEDFEARMKALELGADDYISKPISEQELLMRVSNHLRIKHLADQLENAENVILTLVRILEAKDPYTRGHSERVAEHSRRLAEALELDSDRMQVLRRAALLHDVGKLGVDDAIIHSPSKLTDEEQKKIHDHPTIGIELIASLSFLADTLGPIESHHERFDGTGYPGKLAREQIPLEARIIAIADTFDALTTDRPYQKALTTAAALNEMSSSADSGQLDPELVSKFVEIMREEVSRSTEPDPIE